MSRELNAGDYYRSRGGQIPIRWTAPGMRLALESMTSIGQTDVRRISMLMCNVQCYRTLACV
jgi:hypothetical protein